MRRSKHPIERSQRIERVPPPARSIHDLQREAFRQHGFRFNDLITVTIGNGARSIVVNEAPLSGVSTHGYWVLAVLIHAAHIKPGRYHSGKVVAQLVKDLCVPGQVALGSWLNVDEAGIHTAVCNVRTALDRAHRNRDLIETKSNLGYRIQSPAVNVAVEINGISSRS